MRRISFRSLSSKSDEIREGEEEEAEIFIFDSDKRQFHEEPINENKNCIKATRKKTSKPFADTFITRFYFFFLLFGGLLNRTSFTCLKYKLSWKAASVRTRSAWKELWGLVEDWNDGKWFIDELEVELLIRRDFRLIRRFNSQGVFDFIWKDKDLQ